MKLIIILLKFMKNFKMLKKFYIKMFHFVYKNMVNKLKKMIQSNFLIQILLLINTMIFILMNCLINKMNRQNKIVIQNYKNFLTLKKKIFKNINKKKFKQKHNY